MSGTLINTSPRVIGFFGGSSKGAGMRSKLRKQDGTSTKPLAFRLIPTVHFKLNDDQVNAIVDNPIQARIMRSYIDSGAVVDVNKVFAALPSNKPEKLRVIDTTPQTFDSTKQNEAARVANATGPVVKEVGGFVPPVPVMFEGSFLTPQEQDTDDEDPPVEDMSSPGDITAMTEDVAIAVVLKSDDLELLKQWLHAEGASAAKREGVLAAINKRGLELYHNSQKK